MREIRIKPEPAQKPWDVRVTFSESERRFEISYLRPGSSDERRFRWCVDETQSIGSFSEKCREVSYSEPVGKPNHYIIFEDEERVDVAHSESSALKKCRARVKRIREEAEQEVKDSFVSGLHDTDRDFLRLSASKGGLFLDDFLVSEREVGLWREDKHMTGPGKLYRRWDFEDLEKQGLVKINKRQVVPTREAMQALSVGEPVTRYSWDLRAINLRETKDGEYLVTYWEDWDASVHTKRFKVAQMDLKNTGWGLSWWVVSDNNYSNQDNEKEKWREIPDKGLIRRESDLDDSFINMKEVVKKHLYFCALSFARGANEATGLPIWDRTRGGFGFADWEENYGTMKKINEYLDKIRPEMYDDRHKYREPVRTEE
jgi:hypothetical protein